MLSDSRPRRTLRAVNKVPTELTAAAAAAKPGAAQGYAVPPPPRPRRPAAGHKPSGKGKGKRAAASSEDEVEEIVAEPAQAPNARGKGRNASRAAKARPKADKTRDLGHVLTDPQSPLVNLDISDVLNFDNWSALSPESRTRLCKLLPPTALGVHAQALDSSHPSRRLKAHDQHAGHGTLNIQNTERDPADGQVDEKQPLLQGTSGAAALSDSDQDQVLDPSFFTDPYFESAARTFQDHLYSGWQTREHRAFVEQHLAGVRVGALHAPWKDEVWEREHPEDLIEDLEEEDRDAPLDPSSSVVNIGLRGSKSRGKGKESAKVSDLAPLIRKGFLQAGDVISFKKKFNFLGDIVEKDALVSAIHPKTHALTLLTTVGHLRDLPPSLLVLSVSLVGEIQDSAGADAVREAYASNPSQIANALLDLDGRVPRTLRPRFDAWKALKVWRWPGDTSSSGLDNMMPEEAALLERGGREDYGTLFYLRGAAFDV
ncbi:Asx homology domain-containing protein [Phellopilus nigrolimitatus]|nr:Asx homology domain-containing protein [Phellopilus nigrolimitatus]